MTAPSLRLLAKSSVLCGSNWIDEPRPLQLKHAPYGELKLNVLGSISENSISHSSHRNSVANEASCQPVVRSMPFSSQDATTEPAFDTRIALSMASSKRSSIPSLTMMRSRTASIVHSSEVLERGKVFSIVNHSVDSNSNKPLFSNLLDRLLMNSLLPNCCGREYHQLCLGWQLEQSLTYLPACMTSNLLLTAGANQCSNTSHQQSKIVVNFRERSNRASALRSIPSLIEAKCRLNSRDTIDIRTWKLID